MDYRKVSKDGSAYIETSLKGYRLLTNPLLNKGMAFTAEERRDFKLRGLLPPNLGTLERQVQRSYQSFSSKPSDIEKYLYLRDLQDSNETLFYALMQQHLDEMLPIVYTPTVGEGCQRYSHIYRRPRGLFLSYPDAAHMDEIFAHPRYDHIKVIVVSDGERILGLGDQGAGGMGIPIGKLALYTACAGFEPESCLPILLDTGTNNTDLFEDPLYIGWHHERVRGAEYDAFIERFVKAVKKRWPGVLLQWEDFAQANALPILERYRDQLCTFNDDIQGTACVVVGTLLAAVNITKKPLSEQRIVIVGAGSAGCGIARLLRTAMCEEGLSQQEAEKRFFMVDREGLLLDTHNLLPFQKPFAQKASLTAGWNKASNTYVPLQSVLEHAGATVLVGVSGQAGIFDEAVVREMCKHTAMPIIFPLSNPTTRSEAHPADVLLWSEGRAIVGTGSPYADVEVLGRTKRIDQTNNCYIFPGLGLGLTAVKATVVTDGMLLAASRALAGTSPAQQDKLANLLPPISEVHSVSLTVACAVAKQAILEKHAAYIPEGSLEAHISSLMWQPKYLPYRLSALPEKF